VRGIFFVPSVSRLSSIVSHTVSFPGYNWLWGSKSNIKKKLEPDAVRLVFHPWAEKILPDIMIWKMSVCSESAVNVRDPFSYALLMVKHTNGI